jgi:hypothetical protein
MTRVRQYQKLTLRQLDNMVGEQIEYWFWRKTRTDWCVLELLKDVSAKELKEEMRKLFFESIEDRSATITWYTCHDIIESYELVQKVDRDREKGYNNRIKVIQLRFNTLEKMPLTQHVRRIVDFILDKRRLEPLLEASRGIKPLEPEELTGVDNDGTIWTAIDQYPIVKMFGQDYGKNLMALERAIRGGWWEYTYDMY